MMHHNGTDVKFKQKSIGVLTALAKFILAKCGNSYFNPQFQQIEKVHILKQGLMSPTEFCEDDITYMMMFCHTDC